MSKTITDDEKLIPAAHEEEAVSLMSGEALDDDELDELCEATLASIGDASAKQPA